MAFQLFGKKTIPTAPFSLECEMHPYRVTAGKTESVDLDITLTNEFEKELLTSLVVELPKGLGFDQTALSQEKEVRLGMLQPKEMKHMTIRVWGNQRTSKGSYLVQVYAISHYRDYGYVLNEIRRTLEIRAI
jgi:uncharacterized membrane protein